MIIMPGYAYWGQAVVLSRDATPAAASAGAADRHAGCLRSPLVWTRPAHNFGGVVFVLPSFGWEVGKIMKSFRALGDDCILL